MRFKARFLTRTIALAAVLAGAVPEAIADCVPWPPGLIGWWAAEGNANDSAGTNNGVLHAGATFSGGEVGQAFSFDGVSGYVKVPKAANLDVGSQLTIEFWMKADTSNTMATCCQGLVTSDFYEIAVGGGGPQTVGIDMVISTNGGANWASTGDANGGGTVVSSGDWHHIAGTYDGTQLQLYIDGQPSGNPMPVSGLISPMLANSFVAIGSEAGRSSCPSCAGSRYFKGLIDEVAIYSRALSAGEIAEIYGAGAAGKCTNTPPFITVQPTSQTVAAGANVILSAGVGGAQPLSYQWQLDGTNVVGGTGSTLILTNIQMAQAGTYTLQVTNPSGSAVTSDAVLSVNPAPPCAAPPAGLVGWWRAEGNVWDQIGGNNGTLQNDASFGLGRAGQCFSFGGVSGYVKIPRAPNLDVGGQLTIEFWMKADPSNPMTSCCQGLVTSDFYEIALGGGGSQTVGIIAAISVNGGATTPTTGDANGGGAVVTSGDWHHVAATYDGTQLQLYIDGQPWGNPMPVSGSISPMLANSFVAIGSEAGRTSCPSCVGSRFFKGMIDEVSIYNRALSAAEIAGIYNADVSGKCVVPAAPFMVAQPANQTSTVGSNASVSVVVGGTPPLNYQWKFNGANIAGATNNPLTLSNLLLTQAGSYSVFVSNGMGSLTSSNAVLTLNYPPAQVRVVATNAVAGSTITVPVMVVANGNENALSLSLNFDTTKLLYVGTALGSGASGADLIPNTSLINSGKLGLSLALPPYITLTPGTQQVLQVTFAVAVVSATSTTISFGDQPTLREVSDPQLNLVTATYSNGSVTISAATAFEGDVYPRPNGDKSLTILDWLQMGRFVARLDYPTNAAEFQRADCAPRSTLGDGTITVSDWVQVGRFLAGLDSLASAGGPTSEVAIVGAGPSASRLLSVGQSVLVPGQTTALAVTLSAQGNENAVGVSLAFDPTRVSFTGAVLGADAAGATLYLNTNQLGSGQLGVALALGPGNSFAPGTRELIRLSFLATSFSAGGSSVSPTDQPVPREISDANALALPASYATGTITINPRPSLRITRSGQSVTLAWPLWATNFGLQVAKGRLPPAVSWTNLVVTPLFSNNDALVTLPLTGTNAFYRLYHP